MGRDLYQARDSEVPCLSRRQNPQGSHIHHILTR